MTRDMDNTAGTGWLIERGGLCFGISCGKPAWVTFTDPGAIRFSREQDAQNMLDAWRSFSGVQEPLKGCVVTSHEWVGPETTRPLESEM